MTSVPSSNQQDADEVERLRAVLDAIVEGDECPAWRHPDWNRAGEWCICAHCFAEQALNPVATAVIAAMVGHASPQPRLPASASGVGAAQTRTEDK